MERTLPLVVFLLAAGVAAAPARAAEPAPAKPAPPGSGPAVEVIGLSVAKPDPDSKYGQSMVPGMQPGLAVHCRLAVKGTLLLKLDPQASELVRFTDDKGTKLGTPGPAGWKNPWLGSFPRLSEDKRSCKFELTSRKMLPAAGARTVNIKAKITCRTGADERTVEVKDFALKVGSELTAGGLKMKLTRLKDADGADTKMSLTFENTTGFDAIKKVVFLGPDGKEIPSRSMGSGRFSFGGKAVYSKSYGLAKKVDKVGVRITYFAKVETLGVPIELTVGLGL